MSAESQSSHSRDPWGEIFSGPTEKELAQEEIADQQLGTFAFNRWLARFFSFLLFLTAAFFVTLAVIQAVVPELKATFLAASLIMLGISFAAFLVCTLVNGINNALQEMNKPVVEGHDEKLVNQKIQSHQSGKGFFSCFNFSPDRFLRDLKRTMKHDARKVAKAFSIN